MSLQTEIDKTRKEIRTDSYSMSIGEWISLYENKEVNIYPEFQRCFRWSDHQKSALIESILLGIPIPPIFLGLDFSLYSTKSKLIDEKLLKNRNEIAHGNYLMIDTEEYIELHTEVIGMLDTFKTQIENAAVNKDYKRNLS